MCAQRFVLFLKSWRESIIISTLLLMQTLQDYSHHHPYNIFIHELGQRYVFKTTFYKCWLLRGLHCVHMLLCLIDGLWIYSTLFTEWKCFTKEKEKLCVCDYRSTRQHGIVQLFRSTVVNYAPSQQIPHHLSDKQPLFSCLSLPPGIHFSGSHSKKKPKRTNSSVLLMKASLHKLPSVVWQHQ